MHTEPLLNPFEKSSLPFRKRVRERVFKINNLSRSINPSLRSSAAHPLKREEKPPL